MNWSARTAAGRALQAVLLALVLGGFLVAPTALILKVAFIPDGRPTVSLFLTMAGNPVLRQALWNSLLIGLATTALATALALPFAALLGRYSFPGRGVVRAAVMIPLLLPPFAGTLAIMQFLGRYGTLNLLLQKLGWASGPIDFLGSGMAGTILLEGLHLFPILYFSLVNHFAALNGDSEEAALCFGGKNLAYFRRILLPEIRPGLFAGMALVFVWAFTDLGTPLLMEFRAVLPYQAFSLITDHNQNPMGHALTVIMGVVGLGGYWFSQRLGRNQAQALGKGSRPAVEKRLGGLAGAAAALILGGVLLLASIPMVFLVLLAFAESWFLSIGPDGLTGDHFGRLLEHRITRGSIQTSLLLSSLACLLDLALGFWFARLVLKGRGFTARLLETLAMAPLALPGIILAFGYVALFSGTPLDPAGNPLFLLVMAYAMRRLPFAFRGILTGYRSLPAQVDEAAQTLGQGFWGRLWDIHLPLLTPYLLSAGMLVFAFSMLEVSDSLVLAMKEYYYPITKAMYFLTSRAGDGNNLSAALAVIGMAILAIAIGTASRLLGRKFGEMFR